MIDPRENPEIVAVFAEEARQYVRQMTDGEDPEAIARAIHGVKGAAGMMGFDALYRVIAEHERRYEAGDPSAVPSLGQAIGRFLDQLAPERDSFLPGDREELGRYFENEAAEHLQTIERVISELGDDPDDASAAEELRRALHTLKGAADAVERREIAQAAHAMEDLADPGVAAEAPGRSPAAGLRPSSVKLLADALPLLAAIVSGDEESAAHLRELRSLSVELVDGGKRADTARGLDRRRRVDRRRDPEGIIRVETRAVDGLLDGVGELSVLSQRLGQRATAIRRTARDVAATRLAVAEALRAIGPPRPWGPPSASLTSLAEVAAELSATAAALDSESDALAADEETLRRVSHDAREDLGRMRMAEARWLFERVAATIDTEGRRTGRAVVVRSEGTNVEIERALAERLVEPMTQLARNGVIHGIEGPETRARSGKPLTGHMTLQARLVGGDVALRVSDDGRGIDIERIRTRGVELGLVSPSQAAHAPPREILDWIFLPGFSTRTTVDEGAGRGVGLDVVRREVERLGGRVRVETVVNAGTTFEVRFQARLFMLWALGVKVGDQHFALPIDGVQDVTPLGDDTPVVSLASVLGIEPARPGRPMGVRIETGKGIIILEVDAVLDPTELVTRRMPALLDGLAPFLGTTLAADGRVTLVLDPEAISGLGPRRAVRPRRLHVLVVEDSATTRELLGSMLRHGGHLVELAADGREALRRLADRAFDVVVTDLAMPHVDGRALVERIRARVDGPQPGIVIVSSRASAENGAFAASRAAVLLAKPVARQRLLTAVDRVAPEPAPVHR